MLTGWERSAGPPSRRPAPPDAIVSFLDTATLPTVAMLDATREAVLGDDVYGQDPTVRELERLAAGLLGHEAAVLMPSGTMANLVALMVHCRPGDEVVVEAFAHLVWAESGGMAAVAGCMPLLVEGERGILRSELIERHLRPSDQHNPRTTLVCVENTHNRAGGTITTPTVMRELRELCDARGLALHVDGARLFNAAVALGVPAAELATTADSVSVALSKGLSAPVGSVLVGSGGFIAQARRARKLLGGGMRQAGGIAAAGIVALRDGVTRLSEDHRFARVLANRLAAFPALRVDPDAVETNIVLCDVAGSGLDGRAFATALMERGVHASPRPPHAVRFVTHRLIGGPEVELLIAAIEDVLAAQGMR